MGAEGAIGAQRADVLRTIAKAMHYYESIIVDPRNRDCHD